LSITSPTTPAAYYRYDRQTHKLEKLGTRYPALASTTIADVKPVRLFARDGHFIPAFLSLPTDGGTTKLPLIIIPNANELLGEPLAFRPMVAFLAASGYAVLQIGPYARPEKNGRVGWEQMVDDIADGANYLVEIGVADPARICIGGSDIKGYLALMSTVRYPGLYKCVYSFNGTTDLKTLIRGYRGSDTRRALRELFGGENGKSFKTASPNKRAADIKVPLLLFQTEFSRRRRDAQTKDMIKALDRAKDRYDLVEYGSSGDATLTSTQRTDMFSRLRDFLDKNIGAGPGRAVSSRGR
jgi:dipeptidyl aminopeptidase/acylaminoacyl peptidase